MKYLIPTLLVLPLLEIFVLIEVGSYIGALSTIGLVLLTAVLGLVLLRHEGLTDINKARNKLLNEEMPAEEIFTGFFLAIGGLLLITPGFVTDLIGFFCLFPFTRKSLMNVLSKSFFNIPTVINTERSEQDWIEGDFRKEK